LLDLKRLYWNCREFAAGKRRGPCPYAHLGLALPSFDWWQLLHTPPHQVKEKVSTACNLQARPRETVPQFISVIHVTGDPDDMRCILR
jgi:hypothetical protein